jgi:hypothetical protein
MRRIIYGLPLVFGLAGLAASARCDTSVAAQSKNLLKASYVFQPQAVSPVIKSEVETEVNDGIIHLEKMSIVESLASRSLIGSLEKQRRSVREEKFDWQTGGLIHRKTGKRFDIETGSWSRGPVLEFLRIRW